MWPIGRGSIGVTADSVGLSPGYRVQRLELKEAFGQSVRTLRGKRKLSQEELADESSLDRTYISKLERAVLQPTLTTIFEVAAALNIRASELIALVEEELERK